MIPYTSKHVWEHLIKQLRNGIFPSGFDLPMEQKLIRRLLATDPEERPNLSDVIKYIYKLMEEIEEGNFKLLYQTNSSLLPKFLYIYA